MFWWIQYIFNPWDCSIHPFYTGVERFEKFYKCRKDYYKWKEAVLDIPDATLVTIYHVESEDLRSACKDIEAGPGKLFYWRMINRVWKCDFFLIFLKKNLSITLRNLLKKDLSHSVLVSTITIYLSLGSVMDFLLLKQPVDDLWRTSPEYLIRYPLLGIRRLSYETFKNAL